MRPPPVTVLLAVLLAMGCGGDDRRPPDDTLGAAAAPPETGASVEPDRVVDSTAAPGSGRASGAPAPLPSVPVAGADTALGAVAMIGTAMDARVVVQTPAGPIAVAGPHAAAIARLAGMEVWIQGPLSMAIGRAIPPRQITAERFEVRAVNGVAVLDGTLREDGDGLAVVDRRGTRTRLAAYPPELRDLVGRRVWITRSDDGSVASFGRVGD